MNRRKRIVHDAPDETIEELKNSLREMKPGPLIIVQTAPMSLEEALDRLLRMDAKPLIAHDLATNDRSARY